MYDSIMFDGNSFVGVVRQDYDTEHVDDLATTLEMMSKQRQQAALRYAGLAKLAKKHDLAKSYKRVMKALEARQAVEYLQQTLDNPHGSYGTYGDELKEIGMGKLIERQQSAYARLKKHDRKFAELWGIEI